MLDRLISGAGSLTDRADRFALPFTRRAWGDQQGVAPGSLVVAGVLLGLAVLFAMAGLEATDDPSVQAIGPDLRIAAGLRDRTFATIEGGVSYAYVETYVDDNGNDTQDAGERGVEWFYFIVDPTTRNGVTVRSERPPSTIFRLEATGEVIEDPTYISEDRESFADTVAQYGITLDGRRLVDATLPPRTGPQRVDLAGDLPPDGSPVTVSGELTGTWVAVCSEDPDGDGDCDDAEVDAYDVILFDEASKRGVVVVTPVSPEFTTASFTGMLRRDERSASHAIDAGEHEYDDLELDLSEEYILDDGTTPSSAPLAFGLAALCGITAGVILVGLAGGYLIYRRGERPMPAPATTMAIGDRIPLRVTGILRAASDVVRVRDVPADLLRYQTSEAAPVVVSAAPAPTVEPSSTLIIERRGRPEGVAVGLDELERLTSGTVYPLRGERPALRIVAGTGPILLSFDSDAERDRAAAELLDESGLDAASPTIEPPHEEA